jgi:hypothetical protein
MIVNLASGGYHTSDAHKVAFGYSLVGFAFYHLQAE